MPQTRTSCRSAMLAAATLALLAATGCASTNEPQETARSTLQTAPADLQLLCASAVSTQTGTASDKVLPISSRQIDGATYQVELDAAGKRHSCTVDNNGNVTSVRAG
ncbi:hypothetical protein [Mesorhizobium marinum]|uniref:PepSY domain-containing protein n=1 Tax=Mesorhizobium marinum TaxID=3228790 RepID=A0ABV3R168_9HYPH